MSVGTGGRNRNNSVFEKNQQLLKALVKEPGNKFCADCKTSGHPRWTSWSLGVFLCIRYWEAKLPSNYAPDDSKIDNFIRTKYEMRRWVRSDRLPEDPSVLDNLANKPAGSEDETVPLSEVQRRLVTEPKKRGSVSSSTYTGNTIKSSSRSKPVRPVVDLLGGADLSAAPTTSTQHRNVISSPGGRVSVEKSRSTLVARSAAPKPPTTDLLGLDFGPPAAAPSHTHNSSISSSASSAPSSAPRPAASPAPATPTNSRPDLAKSILSLYSSTPMQPQQVNAAPAQTNSANAFASFQSNGFDGFVSASPAVSTVNKPSVDLFSNLQSPTQSTAATPAQKSNGLDSLSFLTGNLNLGAAPATTATNLSATSNTSNALNGLFSTASNASTGWSSPSPTTTTNSIPSVTHDPWTTSGSTAAAATITSTSTITSNTVNSNGNSSASWNISAWDTKPATNTGPSWATSNQGWGNASSGNFQPLHVTTTTTSTATAFAAADDDDEWDDFKSTGPAVPAGGAINDDLFGNVWK